MKVYNLGGGGNGTIFVTPGKEHPETTDWVKLGSDPNTGLQTRTPIQFTVKFERGVAQVPDNLGRYLIAKQLARKSPLILRERTVVTNAPARRAPTAVGRPLEEVYRR